MVTEEYRKSEYRSRIIARREESGFAVRNLVFTLPLISTVLKVINPDPTIKLRRHGVQFCP